MEEALTERYAIAPVLLRDFAAPLMRGSAITMGDPLSAKLYLDLIGGMLASESAFAHFQLELQRRANRSFVDPPLIELHRADLDLVATAYQFCWFFHGLAEDHRVWDRRQRNLYDEAMELVARVPAPPDDVAAFTRHLLLRHLPRVVRNDTHLSFNMLWGDLHFKGTEPKWLRLPGRRNPAIKRETVWLARTGSRPELRALFDAILARSPLTRLLGLPELGPQTQVQGLIATLAVPRLCRYATLSMLEGGLPDYMAPLAITALDYIRDADAPVLHRRYLAKFVYNLCLTWCMFADDKALTTDYAASGPTDSSVAVARRKFTALIAALHDFRGELGAAHLFADPDLERRVGMLLDASRTDPATERSVRDAVRAHLRFAGA